MMFRLIVAAIFIVPCFSILDVELGKACVTSADCAIAYSRCHPKNKTCGCLNGFSANAGLCKPAAHACPSIDQKKPQVSSKFCVQVVNDRTGEVKHNCSRNEYCLVHPYSKTANGSELGSCCSEPPLDARLFMACPIGLANATGTCPSTDDLPADAPAPPEKIRTCSYSDDECVWHKGVSVCCPRPCTGSSSFFNIEGRCYDYSIIGQPCVFDAQCSGKSFCRSAGRSSGRKTCQCKTGLIPNHAPLYCES